MEMQLAIKDDVYAMIDLKAEESSYIEYVDQARLLKLVIQIKDIVGNCYPGSYVSVYIPDEKYEDSEEE